MTNEMIMAAAAEIRKTMQNMYCQDVSLDDSYQIARAALSTTEDVTRNAVIDECVAAVSKASEQAPVATRQHTTQAIITALRALKR